MRADFDGGLYRSCCLEGWGILIHSFSILKAFEAWEKADENKLLYQQWWTASQLHVSRRSVRAKYVNAGHLDLPSCWLFALTAGHVLHIHACVICLVWSTCLNKRYVSDFFLQCSFFYCFNQSQNLIFTQVHHICFRAEPNTIIFEGGGWTHSSLL